MAKQSTLDALGFESQEEFFDYIIESAYNGQFKQAWGLLYTQERSTRQEFFTYAKETRSSDDFMELLLKLI